MKLLIVDEDLHFGRILGAVLGNDGHDVRVVTELGQGMAALGQHRPQVMLVAVDGTDPRSMAFVTQARAVPYGAAVSVLLLAARLDDSVRRLAETSGAAQTFQRPFSVLDLAAAVRGLAMPSTPVATASFSGTSRLDLDNTNRILRLWARKANGELQIGTGVTLMRVTLADGGPLDLEAELSIRDALHGGELEFQPHDVDGSGDERALGAWIWAEAEATERGREAPPGRATIVTPTRMTEVAGRLPLPPALTRLLAGLVGPVSLGRLADQQGVDVAEIAEALATLSSLGIVATQAAPNTPVSPPPPARTRPTTARDDLGGVLSQSRTYGAPTGSGAGRTDDPFNTRPSSTSPPSGGRGDPFATRPPSGAARAVEGNDPFAPLRQSAPTGVSRPEPARALPPAAPTPPPVYEAPRPMPAPVRPAPAPLPPPPTSFPAVARAPGGAAHGGTPSVDSAAVIRRLRREVDLLRSSDPWTVLSVPHAAERAIVDQAGARMRARYGDLAKANTGEIQQLAEEILLRIEEACAALDEQAVVAPSDLPGDDAFRAGLTALSAGDWAAADRRFIAARDQNLDSARNLAHVGWARVHNPEYPAAERATEGLDLLLLAEQLDPAYADGQYFLAMVLHRRGEDDMARRRIARALRAEPAHVAANALARKLRRPPNT